VLKVENIVKKYGDLSVLKGVSLSVDKGEVVCVVGPSGAGKSTLLHIIGTLDNCDEGNVYFNQIDIKKLKEEELSAFRNKNLGFVFQFHHLLPEFTALENVSLPGWIAKRDEKEVKNKAIELLNFLGLSERINHKPAQMSGGEQQRVAVARALINNPSMVLADEPSGNLDVTRAKELHKLFFDIREQFGTTFIIVTHNEELSEMADRKLVMQDGIIIH
jgi:lipoprotein-releasing system ATP-binding protein